MSTWSGLDRAGALLAVLFCAGCGLMVGDEPPPAGGGSSPAPTRSPSAGYAAPAAPAGPRQPPPLPPTDAGRPPAPGVVFGDGAPEPLPPRPPRDAGGADAASPPLKPATPPGDPSATPGFVARYFSQHDGAYVLEGPEGLRAPPGCVPPASSTLRSARGGRVEVSPEGRVEYEAPTGAGFWGDDHFDYPLPDGCGAYSVRLTIDPSRLGLSSLESQYGNGFVVEAAAGGNELGSAVASLGDVNGDGLSDSLVVAPRASAPGATTGGAAYVVFGKADSSRVATAQLTRGGPGGFAIFGTPDRRISDLAGAAGDVNGDGLGDAIFSDPSAGEGTVYVVYGKADSRGVYLERLSPEQGFSISGPKGERAGTSISAAGDVNGDGFGDLAVAASSKVYVVFGSATPSSFSLSAIEAGSIPGIVIEGDISSYEGLSAVGDVDGDGLDDLLVLGSEGAFVVHGRRDTGPVFLDRIRAGGAGGTFIESVSSVSRTSISAATGAGDVNGDGLDDILLALRGEHRRFFVQFGKLDRKGVRIAADGASDTPGFLITSNVDVRLRFRRGLARAGDLNGDGLGDVAIVAPGSNGARGAAYVVFGKTGTDSVQLEALAAPQHPAGFALRGLPKRDLRNGAAVSTAGDVNGDGLDDLLLGAPNTRLTGDTRSSGVVEVLFGWDASRALEFRYGTQIGKAKQDPLFYSGEPVVRLRGASGLTTLFFRGAGHSLDLTTLHGRVQSVETIDLRGEGPNTLRLDDASVRRLPERVPKETTDGVKRLRVIGDQGDRLRMELLGYELSQLADETRVYRKPDAFYELAVQGEVAVEDTTLLVRDDRYAFVRGANRFELAAGKGLLANDSLPSAGQPHVVADKFGTEAGGWATTRADGSFEYEPPGKADFWGEDWFRYTVRVGGNDGRSAEAMVQLTVSIATPGAEVAALREGKGHGLALLGAPLGPHLRSAGASAGDFDGDGFSDWLVSLRGAAPKVARLTFGGEAAALQRVVPLAEESVGESAESKDRKALFFTDVDGEREQYSAAGAGDVNGDGFDDTMVFAEGGQPPVYVAFGGPTRPSAFPLHELRDDSAASGELRGESEAGFAIRGQRPLRVGRTAAAAGDVNGDGLGDLVVTADYGRGDDAVAYVVFGRTGGDVEHVKLADLETKPGSGGFAILSDQGVGRDTSVSGAGDVNGDGLADVVVGLPSRDVQGVAEAGAAFVVFGQRDPVENIRLADLQAGSPHGWALTSTLNRDRLGRAVSSAGDVNGDGFSDVIVGARLEPSGPARGVGAAYVVYGRQASESLRAEELNASPDRGFRLRGAAEGDYAGQAVSAAGDVDGDGIDDLLVGAPYADRQGEEDVGLVYLLFGRQGGLPSFDLGELESPNTRGGLAFVGATPKGLWGSWLAAAGDVNGDGFDDWLGGAPHGFLSDSEPGDAYVFFGWNQSAAEEPRGKPLLGGAGPDTWAFDGRPRLRIDGGNGDNSLRFEGGPIELDVPTEGQRLRRVNRFDLSGSGENSLVLDDASIRRLARPVPDLPASLDKVLVVDGDADDRVRLDLAPFEQLAGDEEWVLFRRVDTFYGLKLRRGVLVCGADGSRCAPSCPPGFHACRGNCVSDASVETCGASCEPCLAPEGAAPTCDGQACGFECASRHHLCAGVCVLAGVQSCGEGCVDCTKVSVDNGRPSCRAGACVPFCDRGFHECNGRCVSNASPESCGSSCTACPGAPNASAVCRSGGRCAIECDPGFHDCSGYRRAEHDRLDPDVIEASTHCVDDDSVNTCGRSCTPCPTPENGRPLCVDQRCGVACDPGFHDCGGRCVSDASRETCGQACESCPAPPGAVATCEAGRCGFACLDPAGCAAAVAVFDHYSFERGGETFSVSAPEGLLKNDLGGARVSAESRPTSRGGAVRLEADGSFVYSPPGGSAFWGNDDFRYSLSSAVESSAQVRLSVIAPVWERSDFFGGGAVHISPAMSRDGTGRSVSSAGDVNGDGFDDVIVSAPSFKPAGRAFVLFGGESRDPIDLSRFAPTPDGGEGALGGFAIVGTPNDGTGLAVAGVGDVNGDGYDDVAVGAPQADFAGTDLSTRSSHGAVYVVFGKPDSEPVFLEAAAHEGAAPKGFGFAILGPTGSSRAGQVVASAGDANGDGLGDVVVGTSKATFVVFGRGDESPVQLAEWEAGNDRLGYRISASGAAVAGGGDVNGDGLDDVLVGVPGSTLGGRIYIVPGQRTSKPVSVRDLEDEDNPGFVISAGYEVGGEEFWPPTRPDQAGHSVAVAGDVNGDGYADVIVGAPETQSVEGRQVGSAYVVFGKPDGAPVALQALHLGSPSGFAIYGDGHSRSGTWAAGSAVASAGDFDGDGLADILVGTASPEHVYLVFGKSDAGAVHLSSLAGGSAAGVRLNPSGGGREGDALSGAGDGDGDGFSDFLVGTSVNAYLLYGHDARGRVRDRHGLLKGEGGLVDDVIPFAGERVMVIDGRAGQDVLSFVGSGLHLDLSQPLPHTRRVEHVNLRGSGANSLTLEDADVRSLPETRPADVPFGLSKMLRVEGDADDTLYLDLDGYDRLGESQSGRVYGRPGAHYGLEIVGELNVEPRCPQCSLCLQSCAFGRACQEGRCPHIDEVKIVSLRELEQGDAGYVLDGEPDSFDCSGLSVAALGDVNGDRVGDFAIGSFGRTYVRFGERRSGRVALPLAGAGYVVEGGRYAFFGLRLDALGDFDGDGLNDLLLVDHDQGPKSRGRAYVAFGKPGFDPVDVSGSGSGFVTISLGADLEPVSAEAAGDINSDGLADVVIGRMGGANLVYGRTERSPIDASQLGKRGLRLTLAHVPSRYFSATGVGDFDGDGANDLAFVGQAWAADGLAPLQEAYIWLGQPSLAGELALAPEQLLRVVGPGITRLLGVGDINGDGASDVGVFTDEPGAFVVFGRREADARSLQIDLGSLDKSGFRIFTKSRETLQLAPADDLNRDGLSDLLVGRPDARWGHRIAAGRAHLVFGKSDASSIFLDAYVGGRYANASGFGGSQRGVGATFEDTPAGDNLGQSIAGGDFDGDGYGDLLLGTSCPDNNRGAAYVVWGAP